MWRCRAIPTLGAALWAATRTSDEHRERCAAELGGWLRLTATIERVTHPRPGSTRYDDLRLADPETGEPVAAIASLEVRDDDETTTLVASGAVLHSERSRLIWDAVLDRLRAASDGKNLRLVAADLEVSSPAGSFSLVDLRGGLDQSANGSAAWISFRGVGFDGGR